MTYTQCRECGFQVTPKDEFCPDCGVRAPFGRRESADTTGTGLQTKLELAFVGLVAGSLVAASTLILYYGEIGVLGAGATGFVTVWAAARIMRAVDALSARRDPQDACLRQTETVAQQRLADIEARKARLDETWAAVRAQDATPRWQGVRAALQEGLASLNRQSARYRITLWEIALIRWRNSLEPLVEGIPSLGYEECGRRQVAAAAALEAGKALLQEWQSSEIAGHPQAVRCIERLRASLAACNELHQELVARQAMLALRGVQPSEGDASLAAVPSGAPDSLGLVDARIAAVGEVCSAFAELEQEYARMQSEERAAASVEAMLGRR